MDSRLVYAVVSTPGGSFYLGGSASDRRPTSSPLLSRVPGSFDFCPVPGPHAGLLLRHRGGRVLLRPRVLQAFPGYTYDILRGRVRDRSPAADLERHGRGQLLQAAADIYVTGIDTSTLGRGERARSGRQRQGSTPGAAIALAWAQGANRPEPPGPRDRGNWIASMIQTMGRSLPYFSPGRASAIPTSRTFRWRTLQATRRTPTASPSGWEIV